MKLSQPEWDVMEVLWSGSEFSLKEITSALYEKHQWSSNTVHTYLTRMNKKELLTINLIQPQSARKTVPRQRETTCLQRFTAVRQEI